jgi:type IV secretory pathway VirJ component
MVLLKRNKIVLTCSTLLLAVFVGLIIVVRQHKTSIDKLDAEAEPIIIEKVVVGDNRGVGTLHTQILHAQIFHNKEPEKGLLIYIANKVTSETSVDYAKQFAGLSYYVAKIDASDLLSLANKNSKGCINLSVVLSEITQQLQQAFHINKTLLPIVIGDGDAAALVYVALAQSEKEIFHAGISLNFAPRISTSRPFCSVHDFNDNQTLGDRTLKPAAHLDTSWYVFQSAKSVGSDSFIAGVNNAKLTLSGSDPGKVLDQSIQILQWLDPRLADQISSNNSESELPLVEVLSQDTSGPTLAVLLTGDGGWAEIDKNIARILATKGIPSVGFDSLSYFWRARTPEETASDIDKVITDYSEKWQKKRVVLIGYSFGADVLPFVANRLSSQNKEKVSLVALLGLGETAAFEFRLSSWLDADTNKNRLPVLPEIKNMLWANSICIYGAEDDSSICGLTKDLTIKAIRMNGDHHFDEDYELLVQHIVENLKH